MVSPLTWAPKSRSPVPSSSTGRKFWLVAVLPVTGWARPTVSPVFWSLESTSMLESTVLAGFSRLMVYSR